ncbi:hypothetical protein VE02_10228 [Pseudogymnoascus sp. 03VT05]|nr:hypothetical protein VE02_10228 [Pseudogymnoascus sp. 03VT05]
MVMKRAAGEDDPTAVSSPRSYLPATAIERVAKRARLPWCEGGLRERSPPSRTSATARGPSDYHNGKGASPDRHRRRVADVYHGAETLRLSPQQRGVAGPPLTPTLRPNKSVTGACY